MILEKLRIFFLFVLIGNVFSVKAQASNYQFTYDIHRFSTDKLELVIDFNNPEDISSIIVKFIDSEVVLDALSFNRDFYDESTFSYKKYKFKRTSDKSFNVILDFNYSNNRNLALEIDLYSIHGKKVNTLYKGLY